MKIKSIVILLLTFCLSLFGMTESQMDKYSKEELLEKSWYSPSATEKLIIRAYLANKYPESQEGLLSKGYIAGKNSDEKMENKYYEQCDSLYCFSNKFKEPTKENALEVFENFKNFLNKNYNFDNYKFLRKAYLDILEYIPNFDERKKLQKKFLQEWENKIGKDVYVFDYLRGLNQEFYHKNYKKAKEYYESALEKKGAHQYFPILEHYIDLQNDKLFDASTMGIRDKYTNLLFAEKYLKDLLNDQEISKNKKNIYAYNVYKKMGYFMYKNRYYKDALDYYIKAYKYYPTSEMASSIASTMEVLYGNFYHSIDALERISKELSNNYSIYDSLAIYYTKYNKLQKAEDAYKKALKYAPNTSTKWSVVWGYGDFLENYKGEYEKAYNLYKPFLDSYKGNSSYVNLKLLRNRIAAKDLVNAKKYLDKTTYKDKHEEEYLLEKLEKRSKMIASHFNENKFSKKWNENNMGGMQVDVNFQTGSAKVRKSDYVKLNNLANTLQKDGASEYFFKIDGHTDSIGSDTTNNALSIKRANSVVDYLVNKHSIDRVRLDANGYGSKYPIASNDTDNGRYKNRRVEISLAGNINKPTLEATTSYHGDWFDISSDGKFIASGYDPVRLWDTQKMIKLDDIAEDIDGKRKFSPNGKYLALLDFRYNKAVLLIYDTLTQKMISQKSLPFSKVHKSHSYIEWSPFSDELIVFFGYRTTNPLIKYSLKKQKITQVVNHYNRAFGDLKWSKNGKYIFFMETVSKGKIIVYDAKTLKIIQKFKEVNWPHAIGITNNGKYLVVVDNTRTLHRWDIKNNFKHNSMAVRALPKKIVSHPSKSEVIINDFAGNGNNLGVIVDLENMKSKHTINVGKNKYVNYAFIDDGKKILASFRKSGGGEEQDHIKIYDNTFSKQLNKFNGETNFAKRIFKIEDNNKVLTSDQQGIHVWDIGNAKKIHQWKIKNVYKIHQLKNKPSQFIIISRQNNTSNIYKIDGMSFTKTHLGDIALDIFDWGIIDNNKLFVSGVKFFKYGTHSGRGYLRLYNLDNFTTPIKQIEIDIVTEVQRYNRLYETAFKFALVSPDKNKVAVLTKWQDGWGQSHITSKNLRIYDFNSAKELKNIRLNNTLTHLAFKDSDHIEINSKVINLNNGNETKVIDKSKKNIYDHSNNYSASLNSVVFDKRNLKVILKRDNIMEFRNNTNNNLVLSIINKKDNKWIAYTPQGNYTSSLNGTDKVFWKLGGKLLPISAFKGKYKDNKVIKLALNNLYNIKKINIKEFETIKNVQADLFKPPYTIKVISEKSLITKSDNYELRLSIKKDSKKLEKPEIKIIVNGRALKKQRALKIKTNKKADFYQNIKLQNGINIIQVNYIYKGITISVDTVTVTKKFDNAKLINMTNLWFFAVGVSDYEISEQNLQYAHLDAIKLSDVLKAQEGKLFGKVNTKVLTNEKATARNVKVELRRFLSKASSNDMVIIFIAGHGVQDNSQNLYFLTHDGDGSEPYTGLEISNFDNYLKSRPLTQKAILWMDICHSGTLGERTKRGITSEDAVKQLADGTGAVIFASSTGREYSLESKEYGGGHGAFTYSLIEGLKGNADIDKNGIVSILELHNFVSSNVPQITNGGQHPTSTTINLRDFPISKF